MFPKHLICAVGVSVLIKLVAASPNTTCGTQLPAGYQTCGLGLCCSVGGQYCGFTSDYCSLRSCNPSYGHCGLVASPNPPGNCSSSGTVGDRSVGYYQASGGLRGSSPPCSTLAATAINTSGFTHVNFAFLSIDAAHCAVLPASNTQPYKDFVAKKSSSTQTWISVGGAGNNGDVAETWSIIASSSSCRTAFATSLTRFVAQYEFQGADIDWEIPQTQADMNNMVTLISAIQGNFNNTYGLSVYLPADFGSLLGFDPTAMQQYVDFFNFGSYDLHDATSGTQGVTDAQTNTTEIDTNLIPLWYAGINPAKVNLGLAYYGRTYTLSSPATCAKNGCPFSGPGAAGACTQSAGVLSNQEIQALIVNQSSKPTLDSVADVKYLLYNGSSLVFYDDADTFKLKRSYANSRCLGGTMVWSLDFNNVGSQ